MEISRSRARRRPRQLPRPLPSVEPAHRAAAVTRREALFALTASLFGGRAAAAAGQREIWFCPAAGSLDLRDLYERKDEWSTARSRIQVVKFYQWNLFPDGPAPLSGVNQFDVLKRLGVFPKLDEWGIKIAAEVGAIKPQYCTVNVAAGVEAAVRETIRACTAVLEAGTTISSLALDEPFLAATEFLPCRTRFPLLSVVDRLRTYIKGVRAWYRRVGRPVTIGLIEPYPFFSRARLCRFATLMVGQGIAPDFFHLDVDLLEAMNRPDVNVIDDLRLLDNCFSEQGIKFGIIIWGNNGLSDAMYFDSAMQLVLAVKEAFGNEFPDLIFQSWVPSPSGQLITPNNLPEDRPYSHTFLINHALACLETGECTL